MFVVDKVIFYLLYSMVYISRQLQYVSIIDRFKHMSAYVRTQYSETCL